MRARSILFTTTAIFGWCLMASAQLEELIDVSDPSNKTYSFLLVTTLTKPEVQQELALTETQQQEIKRWDNEQRAFSRSQPRVFDLNDLSKEEREQRMRDSEENRTKVAKGMIAVLDDTQKSRLAQLRLQQLGSLALKQRSVITALRLSDDQQTRIQELMTAQRDASNKRYADLPKDATENRAQRDVLLKESSAAMEKLKQDLLAVLTAAQRTQWDALQGKKFELPRGFTSRIAAEPVIPAIPTSPDENALNPARAALLSDAITMLDEVAVWKELKATEAQSNTLTNLLAQKRQAFAELQDPQARQQFNKEENQARDNSYYAVVRKIAAQMLQVFDDRQIERLEQIKLQKEGARTLLREDIAQRLKLSKEQRTQLRRVQFDTSEEHRKLLDEQRNGAGARQNILQFPDKLREIQEKANKAYLKVLTDEQKADFEALMGPKFEIPDPLQRIRQQLRNRGKSDAV